MAKHNATIYNVHQRIEFIIGDCLKLAPHFRVDAVFLSPPWGGPQYRKDRVFDLKRINPDGYFLLTPH
jgi:trimethylguanosine synthase